MENPTPRAQKPTVDRPEGGQVSATAVGLIGGVLGVVGGVSLMAVRELGRQQKNAQQKQGQQDAGNDSREG